MPSSIFNHQDSKEEETLVKNIVNPPNIYSNKFKTFQIVKYFELKIKLFNILLGKNNFPSNPLHNFKKSNTLYNHIGYQLISMWKQCTVSHVLISRKKK